LKETIKKKGKMYYICKKKEWKGNGLDRMVDNDFFADGRYPEYSKEETLLCYLAFYERRLVHILPHEGAVCIQPVVLCLLLSFNLGNN
jgi:hypothetical protein